MKRLLVTGATGFIGRHVLDQLKEADYEIHVISRNRPSFELSPQVVWHIADLFHQEEIERVMADIGATHLLHLAWEATPGQYVHSPNNYKWVEASMLLWRLFHKYGGRRAVGAGTCAEYEWREQTLSETDAVISTATPYAACKNEFRQSALSFSSEHGLSFAWGRLFFLYGPYEHEGRLVPSVVLPLLRGEVARCTDGLHKRDFLYAGDAARAFIILLDSTEEGIFNLSSGCAIPIIDVVNKIALNFGRPDLVHAGAIPSNGQAPLVEGDNQRLRSIGWQPEYDLAAGIMKTIEWWTKCIRQSL